MDKRSKLMIDVRVGDTVRLPGDVSMQLIEKSGRTARVQFLAPAEAKITKQKSPMAVPCMAQSTDIK